MILCFFSLLNPSDRGINFGCVLIILLGSFCKALIVLGQWDASSVHADVLAAHTPISTCWGLLTSVQQDVCISMYGWNICAWACALVQIIRCICLAAVASVSCLLLINFA